MEKFNLKTPHMCPVCGKTEFPEYLSYDICPECGWEDDVIRETDISGANDLDLPEYRTRYKAEGRPAWLDDCSNEGERPTL